MEDDQTGAQETHPGHDLCRDAGGVETLRIRKAELGDHHEEGAAQAHQEMCTDAGLLGPQMALQPDQGPKQAPGCNAQDHFTDSNHICKDKEKPGMVKRSVQVGT